MRGIVHVMARHRGRGLTGEKKLVRGGAAALAIATAVVLGAAGCASKGGSRGAEEGSGRQGWWKTAPIEVNGNLPRGAQVFTLSRHRFVATETALDMIRFAYGEQRPLKPAQVVGGPDWVRTEAFHIDAELPESLSDRVETPLHLAGPALLYPGEDRQTDAVKQVFRSLLIERFRLRIRRETKELPVFELVSAKNGPKIAEDTTAGQPCRTTDIGPGKWRWLDVKSCDLRAFAGLLSSMPELRSRVLVDKSGLHGRYSFKLHWTPEMAPGMPEPAGGGQRNRGAAAPRRSGPSLRTALREQMGLRIVAGKASVDAVVIERIERPASNGYAASR